MKHELPIFAEVRPVEDLAALAAQINAEHEAGEGATRKGLEHFRAAGVGLVRAKEKCGHGKWLPWLKKNVKFSQPEAWRYMQLAKNWDKLSTANNLSAALRLLTDDVPDEEEEDTPVLRKYLSLDRWNEMNIGERRTAFKEIQAEYPDDRFNDQGDNENIEWALWSWNPVTGCLHNCPYCYARDIADRFYEQKFAPSLWPGRLKAPQNTTFPESKASEWMGHKNVFTCSMADLFGRWVPKEWIDAVLAVVKKAPRWNFLFLTKFPQRMAEFEFPDNAWIGTTVDCQARVANAEKAFKKIKANVKWLSCEPLIEPLRFASLEVFNWVVIGGSSRSSQTPEWKPPSLWIVDLMTAARNSGCKVYLKSNLDRVREYPGAADLEVRQAPEPLRYLPGDT